MFSTNFTQGGFSLLSWIVPRRDLVWAYFPFSNAGEDFVGFAQFCESLLCLFFFVFLANLLSLLTGRFHFDLRDLWNHTPTW